MDPVKLLTMQLAQSRDQMMAVARDHKMAIERLTQHPPTTLLDQSLLATCASIVLCDLTLKALQPDEA